MDRPTSAPRTGRESRSWTMGPPAEASFPPPSSSTMSAMSGFFHVSDRNSVMFPRIPGIARAPTSQADYDVSGRVHHPRWNANPDSDDLATEFTRGGPKPRTSSLATETGLNALICHVLPRQAVHSAHSAATRFNSRNASSISR